jgi:aspartate ammonia-lyase
LDSNEHHGDFIVDVIQGGAGTSTNMAANEIIANLANLSLNEPIGSYEIVHPNDHVNLCQSTNDAYPTTAKLAVGLHHEKMVCELKLLIQSFRKKGDEFKYIVKMGRTQLQDAVPMTLGQEFNSFANSLESDLAYLMKNVNALYECNLGGTAIGTSITAHKEFSKESIDALKELTKLPFTSAKDFVEASSSTSSFLLFSSILRRIALKTSKICNDLRLLSSGPRCGFNEIDLPAVAPGSSIMPGKINPVIPEVMNQVCFQVIGADAAISMASEHAQLQLNAFEPLIVYNLLNSLDSMTNGLKVLREKCIDGITANEDVCASHVNNSIGIVTALLPKIGYKKATLVAKTALETNKPVSQVATEVLNFLSQDEADTLLNIENMTGVVAGDKNAEAKRNSYPKRGVDIESPQSAGGDKCNFWSYMYPPERQLFQSAGAM